MLHEMWSTITKAYTNKKKSRFEWKMILNSVSREGNFYLLDCSCVMDDVDDAPKRDELCIFNFSRSNGETVRSFAVVENFRAFNVDQASDVDHRLLPEGKPNAATNFVLRTIRTPKRTNELYVFNKICLLSSAIDQFEVQVRVSDVMSQAIRNPGTSNFVAVDPTKVKESSQENYLDSVQNEAHFSIGQGMLFPNSTPLFALLQGPPGIKIFFDITFAHLFSKNTIIYNFVGTGKTHVIVNVMRHIIKSRLGTTCNRMLYCAPTDSAVDEMTRRLLKLKESLNFNGNFKNAFRVLSKSSKYSFRFIISRPHWRQTGTKSSRKTSINR